MASLLVEKLVNMLVLVAVALLNSWNDVLRLLFSQDLGKGFTQSMIL